MIYTITLNPALDYTLCADRINFGHVNRIEAAYLTAGGKGINVSVVLKALGFQSTVSGFIAGFTGQEIKRQLTLSDLHTDFVELDNGLSRINVKVHTINETEFNAKGPEISKQDIKKLFDKISVLNSEDILVLSGSIPPGVSDTIYREMMTLVKENTRVIVDAAGKLLLNTLALKPFLIKPNIYELSEIFDTSITTGAEAVKYAEKLKDMGAVNVLVSMDKDGAVLIDEMGNVHNISAPSGKAVNSVGAGDSMVAGFIAGYLEKKNYDYALKLAAACGSATAFSEGLADRDKIMEVFYGNF